MLYMRWERFFTRKTQFFEVKNDKESKIIQQKFLFSLINALYALRTHFYKVKRIFLNLKILKI